MFNYKKVIKESKSWTEVCNKTLGIKSSHRIKKLKSIAEKENIDYSHFTYLQQSPHGYRIDKICPVCAKPFKSRTGKKEKRLAHIVVLIHTLGLKKMLNIRIDPKHYILRDHFVQCVGKVDHMFFRFTMLMEIDPIIF